MTVLGHACLAALFILASPSVARPSAPTVAVWQVTKGRLKKQNNKVDKALVKALGLESQLRLLEISWIRLSVHSDIGWALAAAHETWHGPLPVALAPLPGARL